MLLIAATSPYRPSDTKLSETQSSMNDPVPAPPPLNEGVPPADSHGGHGHSGSRTALAVGAIGVVFKMMYMVMLMMNVRKASRIYQPNANGKESGSRVAVDAKSANETV